MQLPFQAQEFFTRQDLALKFVSTYRPEDPQAMGAWITTLPTEAERTQATEAWQRSVSKSANSGSADAVLSE